MKIIHRQLLFQFTRLRRMCSTVAADRMQRTERAYIEDIFDRYSSIPGLVSLAIGSTSWSPPEQAIQRLSAVLSEPEVSKYGSIMGYDPLRQLLTEKFSQDGVDMTDMNVMITCGANQAFTNVSLAICNEGDRAVSIFYSRSIADSV